MKKVLVLSILLCALVLCSCENHKTSSGVIENNTTTKDIIETSSSLSIPNVTSGLAEPVEVAGSEKSDTELSSANISSDGEYYDPIWAGREYGYFSETDTTFETFKEWAKNYGKTEDGSYNLEWNKVFLEWASKSQELLLPVVLNGPYEFNNMSVLPNSESYRMVYTGGENAPRKEGILIVMVRPQTGKDAELSVEEYLIKLIGSNFTNNKDDYKKITKNFKWGDYRVNEYWCIPSEGTAFVKLGNYQVSLFVYGGYENGETVHADWDEKFFDYISFETVSLKD